MKRKQKPERTSQEMSTTTLKMLIDFYLGDMRLKNRAHDSIKTNQLNLERFAKHVGDLRLSDLTTKDVQGYVSTLQAQKSKWVNHPTRPPADQPLSPFTVRKIVKILRGFGTWLSSEGFSNPFDELDIPSVPKNIIEVLTPEEIQKLTESINQNMPGGSRNYAMVLLMLDSGARISEVAGLRLKDLDLQSRQAKILGKGRKERFIPFGHKTAKAIMRYVTAYRLQPVNPEHDQVFLSLDGYPMTRNSMECIVRRMKKTSGIEKLHAHLLRHTFAVNYLAAGGDVETLRRILGHESLEVTKRYLSGLQAEQVKAMYDEFSPVDRLDVGSGGRRFNRRRNSVHNQREMPSSAQQSINAIHVETQGYAYPDN